MFLCLATFAKLTLDNIKKMYLSVFQEFPTIKHCEIPEISKQDLAKFKKS